MTPASLKAAGPRKTPGSFKTLRLTADTKHPLTISEYGSDARTRETETDICLHEDMFPNFNHDENGRHHHLGEEDTPVLLLPNLESRSLNRKSLRKLISLPCSKRPRTEQQNGSLMAAKVHDHDTKKIGYDHARGISEEKCRGIRQKRGQDSKKIDKKSFKVSVKTKFDPFLSKAAFVSSDSASGGIDAIGIYGLKSDLHDVTKHMEELSLDELLDGSYNYPKICPEKGKRTLHGNENIILSVRKACSILSFRGAADNGGNRKVLTSTQNPSPSAANTSDKDDKDSEELSIKDANQDCQANLSTLPLYPPKDILERLALPPSQDIDALVLNLNPSQHTLSVKSFSAISLPPFPWSTPQGGTCKAGVDSCKFMLPKSASQSKWVRIGSSSTRGDKNSFTGLGMKTLDPNDDFGNQRKIDELLQYVKSLSESIMPLVDGSAVVHHSDLVKGTSASGSFNSGKLERTDGHADSSDNHEADCSKDYLFCQNSEPEVGLRRMRSKLSSTDSTKYGSCKGNEIDQEEVPERTTNDPSGICFGYHSKNFAGRCEQSLWHTHVMSKTGHSSQLVTAAAILCEMSSSSNALQEQSSTCDRVRWAPAQTSTRDHESISPVGKTGRLPPASGHHDAFRRTAPPSMKHKLTSEKKTDFVHPQNTGRESGKRSWSAELDGASPRKVERDCTRENQRLLHGSPLRPSGLMHSPKRLEKVCDSHSKLGRETLKASSVDFRESYINDWSRGRSKGL